MITALKIGLILAIISIGVFVADYHRLTKGKVWSDPIGQTFVWKDLFLIGQMMPLLLAAFFQFSTLGDKVGSAILIGFYYLIAVVTGWRTYVFEREDRRKRRHP